MAIPKIIADFEVQLATAIAVGATSFSLSSATDDDGVAIPAGLYYFTVDNGASNKEYLAGTVSGTSVTGVVNVSRQGVETSGAVRAHRVGASVIMTDFATYKKVVEETSVAGAADASQSTKGIVEIATQAEIDAGTATGGTGAPVAVTPDQLANSIYGTRLPSASEKTALTGLTALTGAVIPYAGRTAPSGYLLCDGSAVSRATYASLFSVIAPSAVFTVTIASPAVFTKVAHGLVVGDKIHFTTTGGLPSGLSTNTDYYVIAGGLTADAFEVSATRGGSAVNTSGSQSGVHTFYISNYGKGDGSTTFTLPDFRGMTPYGFKSGDTAFDALNVPSVYVGEKTHALTSAENGPHTHTATTYTTIAGANGFRAADGGSTGTATTDSSGSGTAHNNMPPYVVTQFIIKT
jgi:microcystin-dependent protein